jgi:MFS family permease
LIRSKFTSPFALFPREVKILIVASFFVALGFGIVLPAIPVFARSFGVNNAAVGLIVSAFAVARFCSGLISGKLVDHFGERAIFSSGVAMVALFTLLVGLSNSYQQLLIFRSAGGLGSSMFSVAAGSVIMRSVSDEHRGRAQSLYNGAFLVGGITGPAIGGLLSLISLRAPFFAYSFTLAISGLIAFFFLTGANLGKRVKDSGALAHTTIRQALALRPYRYALVITFLSTWVLFGLRSSVLPIFVIEELNSTTAVVGYGFTLSAIFQGFLLLRAGKISDVKGRRFASLVGTSIVALGVLVMVFTIHPWMYLLSMVILGIGGAYLSTVPATIVGDVIGGKGGQVIALFQMAGDAGMMVGPIIVGAICDAYSYRTAFGATGIIFLIAVVLSYRLPETRSSYLPK